MQVTILVLVVLIHVGLAFKFPDKLVRCHMSDPELDKCIKSTIQTAFNLYAVKGMPEFNLPPADPLELDKLIIGAGTNAVNLVQKYSDVKVFGLSKNTVKNAHFDKDKKILTFTMVPPLIEQKAKYDVDGQVLILPVFGKGDSDIKLFDVTFINTIALEEETKQDKTYFKIKSYKLSISPNSAHYHFDNLFNGDKQLADNILKTINDNWKEIYDDIRSELEAAYAEVFKKVATLLFSTVPIDELF